MDRLSVLYSVYYVNVWKYNKDNKDIIKYNKDTVVSERILKKSQVLKHLLSFIQIVSFKILSNFIHTEILY